MSFDAVFLESAQDFESSLYAEYAVVSVRALVIELLSG